MSASLEELARRFRDVPDEQLEQEITDLRRGEQEFALAHRSTVEDGREGLAELLDRARSASERSRRRRATAFVDPRMPRETLTELALDFVIASDSFREWLEEAVTPGRFNNPAGAPAGYSELSREQKLEKLGEFAAEVRAREIELARRQVERSRLEAEARLAALANGDTEAAEVTPPIEAVETEVA